MNEYMKVLIAMALILGVTFVMVFAVLEIGWDLARQRYPLSIDGDDEDLDGESSARK
jgi:hypothetical protein